MGEYQLVLSTAPDLETAKKIAEYLIEQKIAACCNLLPAMQSVYSWKGKTETEQEVLLLIKSTEENYKKIEHAITELHPYEIPEIIATEIVKGSALYLNWISDTVEGVHDKFA